MRIDEHIPASASKAISIEITAIALILDVNIKNVCLVPGNTNDNVPAIWNVDLSNGRAFYIYEFFTADKTSGMMFIRYDDKTYTLAMSTAKADFLAQIEES